MIKVTQNQYYGKDSEVPAVLPAGSSMFTSTGKMYFYPEGSMVELNAGGVSSSGLKKIVYSVTQSGTDDPVFSLLENNSSLDLSSSVFARNQQGRYTLGIITNDASLFSKFFPSITGNLNSGNLCNIQVFKSDVIGKLGRIDLEVITYEDSILKDNLLFDTLLQIYINE